MKVFLAIIGFLVILIGGPIWSGYVLSVMWNWFLVPAFHMPQISVALAIGITMLVRMITYNPSYEKEKKKESGELAKALTNAVVFSLLYPLLVLAVAYIVHQFV